MQTPWGECEVADAHVHFFSRRFFSALGEQCGTAGGRCRGQAELGIAAATIRRNWRACGQANWSSHGVSQAALIASIPGDESSAMIAAERYPDRFFSFGMVNPWAEHAEVVKGLDAICLFPAMHLYSIQDPRVEALLEQAAAHRVAVFVHCGVLSVGVRKKLGLPSPFDMRYSNPIDLHAVALRHPTVRFIVPHFGAGYFREALMLADLCPNVYLDTSSSNSWMRYEGLDLTTVFRRALSVAGPKRLLFGSDSSFFPRGWNHEILDVQMHALRELGSAPTMRG